MLFVDNQACHDPRINLAIEEYLIRNIAPAEEILFFYINAPSIIIGRNQNTIEEINVDYVREAGLHVVRRLSGGGAVYHDLGNLNFSFIAPNKAGNFHNYAKFTQPVIDVLRAMGVEAELSGRNDILAGGRKISGNAQYVQGARMVSHGTLLWNSDLERVGQALQVKAAKIESKGIKSVRARVGNICDFLPEGNDRDIMAFRERIINGVFGGGEVASYELNENDWAQINALSASRYQQWEWNYGKSPAFAIHRQMRYAGGQVEVWLDVDRGGHIREARFVGDFFGQRDADELAVLLQGCSYAPAPLAERLQGVEVGLYFATLSLEELLSLLY